MRFVLHGFGFSCVIAYLGLAFVLLFLEGVSYQTLLLLPIPLVYVLGILGRRISVALYLVTGAFGTTALVIGRWALDSWLAQG